MGLYGDCYPRRRIVGYTYWGHPIVRFVRTCYYGGTAVAEASSLELQPNLRVLSAGELSCISSGNPMPSLGVCVCYDILHRYVKGVVSRWRLMESMHRRAGRFAANISVRSALRE